MQAVCSLKHFALDYLQIDSFFTIAAINTQAATVLSVLFILLLFLSFWISGAEIAFFSLTYKDINTLKTKQQPGYKRIVDLLETPKLLLASLLIANSFINISIIIIANFIIDELIPLNQSLVWVEFLIKVVAVTFVLLLFGEIMPKVLATQNNIRFAKDAGPVVEVLKLMFGALSRRLVNYSDIIDRRLAKKNNGSYSLEELYHAIDITTGDSAESDNEKNMLKGIAKFSNITVKQIMKTRLDVHGIEKNTSFHTLIKQVEELHYSRLPVYEDDLDKIVGIIHTKDLLPFLEQPEGYNWQQHLRQPYFVHEQKLIEDLLKEFQTKHFHFAVVVDEFGGTSGIVTLEDILEEVIGEIKDEFDEDETGHKKIDDNNYLFEGKTMINDVCKIMELPVDTFDAVKGDSDSLAGLVLEIAGEIPQALQVIPCGDFDFTVMELEKNRVKKIKVTIKPQLPE
jgi:gliding motility-associated protein GldE